MTDEPQDTTPEQPQDEGQASEETTEALAGDPATFATARRERAQTAAQAALDAFTGEHLGVNYVGDIVPRAQTVYLRLLIERGLITEDDAVASQLEIQTSLLKEEFKAALLRRDEDALKRAQEAAQVRPVRGPRLIIPGGKSR